MIKLICHSNQGAKSQSAQMIRSNKKFMHIFFNFLCDFISHTTVIHPLLPTKMDRCEITSNNLPPALSRYKNSWTSAKSEDINDNPSSMPHNSKRIYNHPISVCHSNLINAPSSIFLIISSQNSPNFRGTLPNFLC